MGISRTYNEPLQIPLPIAPNLSREERMQPQFDTYPYESQLPLPPLYLQKNKSISSYVTYPLRGIAIRGVLFIALFGSPLLCLRGGGEGVHRNLRSYPLPWSRCRGGLPSRSPGGYRRGSQDPWKRTHYVTMVSGFTSWFGKEGKPHYQFTPPGRFPTIPQTPHRGS